jgi:DNA-nicking Smr family endonuclease
MTEQTKMQLEQTHILIESQYHDVLYAIDRKTKALYIVQGKAKTQEIRVVAENVEDWLAEVREVWELHRVR